MDIQARIAGFSEPTGIPSKSIILWPLPFDKDVYPQLNDFILCNGANGSPDMRGFFARGVPVGGDVITPCWGCPECASAIGSCSCHCHSVTPPVVKVNVKCCSVVSECVSVVRSITSPFDTGTEFQLPPYKNLNFIMKL